MQSDSHSKTFNDEKDIDWKSFFLIILDHKKFIFIVTTIVTLAVMTWSFSIPNQYTASVLLKLSEEQSQSASSSLGGAAGLASLAGISIGSGNNSANYANAVLGSKKFLSHIASFPGVRENLTAANGFDFKTGKILYKKGHYDGEKRKWQKADANGSPIIPSDLDVIAAIKDRMKVYIDSDTGFITIIFQHFSPVFAYEFINLLEGQLNTIEREKDIRNSSRAITYLNNQLEETRQVDIQNAIYQLIESQLKTQMLANIDEHYLVAPIDPAVIPEQKSFPFRRNLAIVAFILSLLVSSILVLLKHFYLRSIS
ncbi:Wzz/FepE/Etk N-terminal domain-containing protein [Gammaproteobacteria bacterium]|nr:Wzz/FepE/Etk N-terminal domain-containing protein [Gammaproteobacteria bacterium]